VTSRRTDPGEPPKRPPPRPDAAQEAGDGRAAGDGHDAHDAQDARERHTRRPRPRHGYDLKVARRYMIEVPDGICLQCFNMQQQFRFPFLVYCEHKRMLAVVRSATEYTTFQCAPNQLQAVIAKLSETGLDASAAAPETPPKSN